MIKTSAPISNKALEAITGMPRSVNRKEVKTRRGLSLAAMKSFICLHMNLPSRIVELKEPTVAEPGKYLVTSFYLDEFVEITKMSVSSVRLGLQMLCDCGFAVRLPDKKDLYNNPIRRYAVPYDHMTPNGNKEHSYGEGYSRFTQDFFEQLMLLCSVDQFRIAIRLTVFGRKKEAGQGGAPAPIEVVLRDVLKDTPKHAQRPGFVLSVVSKINSFFKGAEGMDESNITLLSLKHNKMSMGLTGGFTVAGVTAQTGNAVKDTFSWIWDCWQMFLLAKEKPAAFDLAERASLPVPEQKSRLTVLKDTFAAYFSHEKRVGIRLAAWLGHRSFSENPEDTASLMEGMCGWLEQGATKFKDEFNTLLLEYGKDAVISGIKSVVWLILNKRLDAFYQSEEGKKKEPHPGALVRTHLENSWSSLLDDKDLAFN